MSSAIEQPVIYKPDYEKRLIGKLTKHINSKDKFFSLEFFPPRTPSGICNLFEKCDRFSKGQPLFCDVSCNVTKDESSDKLKKTFVDVASVTQEITQCDAILQLNASRMTEESAVEILNQAKQNGLQTVMVLSEVSNHNADDFETTTDLIQFIKAVFENYFTICVAGYPHGLDEETEIPCNQTLEYLLKEIHAGADFVITHMVFQAADFLTFVKKCRCLGINVPIIPGILPIQNYKSLQQLTQLSNIRLPEKILNILKPIKDNDEAVLKYGIYLTVELCKILLQNILCCGLHFFTLNQEKATTQVLKEIGLWNELPRRALPWHSSEKNIREGEEVRPIFWSCRPSSYQHRTSEWESFPNGRWGDSSQSGFGSFRDYHLFYVKHEPYRQELKKMWLEEITCLEDIYDVFVSFLSGKANRQGFKVTNIPWSEEVIALETQSISEQLIEINKHGILTINSQPNVNCVPSTNKIFGWGSPGGYVFQKAYLEFFCCVEDQINLLKVLKQYPYVNYHVINHTGSENYTNTDRQSSNAVTWGVYTGKMVLQPTVVDPIAFRYWKDEAFELWSNQWGRLYDRRSPSFKYIQHCHDTFYLINLVDNDYVKGNCLFDIIHEVIKMRTK